MHLTVATVNFLYVTKIICDGRVSWTVYELKVPYILHAGILAQWFEMLLLLPFQKLHYYGTHWDFI